MTEKEIILIVLIRKLPYCNCDLNIVGISFDCLNNSIDYILICPETQTCLNAILTFFNDIQSKTTEYSRSHPEYSGDPPCPMPRRTQPPPLQVCYLFSPLKPSLFHLSSLESNQIIPEHPNCRARGDPAGGWAGGSNCFTHMGSPSASILKPQWPHGLLSSSGLR